MITPEASPGWMTARRHLGFIFFPVFHKETSNYTFQTSHKSMACCLNASVFNIKHKRDRWAEVSQLVNRME